MAKIERPRVRKVGGSTVIDDPAKGAALINSLPEEHREIGKEIFKRGVTQGVAVMRQIVLDCLESLRHGMEHSDHPEGTEDAVAGALALTETFGKYIETIDLDMRDGDPTEGEKIIETLERQEAATQWPSSSS